MRLLLAAGLLLTLSAVAYSNSLDVEFHFDDLHQVVKNQNIRRLDNLPRFFTDASLSTYLPGRKGYRPLTYSSFAVNYALGGYNVSGYHAFNLILHFLNAFLVYLVVRAVLKKEGGEGGELAALFVSLAFALHPAQTGAVTYISGRAALLAAFFCLLAFLSFVRARQLEPRGGAGGYVWALLAAALFLLALLSKEIAVSFIGLTLAYDLIFTVREKGGARRALESGYFYLPVLAALGVFLAVRKAVMGFASVGKVLYSTGDYMLSESKAVMVYLRLMLLPVNQNADYDLPLTSSTDAKVVFSALVIIVLLYLLFRLRRSSPAASFFGFWFFIALAPESSIIPITDIAVEYRLYLPSAGFIAALSALALGRLQRPAPRRAMAVFLILVLGALTFSRNRVWADEYTLWSDTAKKSPGSARAHLNLGVSLLKAERYDAASEEFRLILERAPYYYDRGGVHNNLGICYYQMGRLDDAAREFRYAIEAAPGLEDPHVNLGRIYHGQGRYEEAHAEFLKALELNPGNTQTRYLLAWSYSKLGHTREALMEMEKAYENAPKEFWISRGLAVLYDENNMPKDALRQAGVTLSLARDPVQRNEARTLLKRLEYGGR